MLLIGIITQGQNFIYFFLKDAQAGGEPGIFYDFRLFSLSQLQRLRPLGYGTPLNFTDFI